VVDAPGGGGKRDIHSFEHYDRQTGISVYSAPSVRPGVLFYYFDPLHSLGPEMQERWRDPVEQERMLEAAREAARPTAASSITAAPVTGELPN
jgi:lysine 2,3-aminomutase